MVAADDALLAPTITRRLIEEFTSSRPAESPPGLSRKPLAPDAAASQLPVTRVPGFHSGLVVLGDVLLEVIRSAPFPDPTTFPQGGLFDFQPPVPPWNPVPIGGLLGDRWLSRIAPSRLPPAVARWSNQTLARIWRTRVAGTMFQLMTLTPQVFLVEFHPQIRAALDPERTRRLLADTGGGRIGLTGVRELVIGTPDLDREISRWQALLEPTPPAGVGRWMLPSGPAIRLESSPGLYQRLICEVGSLEAADSFLRAEQLLGTSAPEELQIAPAALAGLDVRLVQATASAEAHSSGRAD